MKIAVALQDVTPCTSVLRYQCFRGICKVCAEKWYGYREGRIRIITVNGPTGTSGPEKGCFVRANAKEGKNWKPREKEKKN
jgi:hypothetical protein